VGPVSEEVLRSAGRLGTAGGGARRGPCARGTGRGGSGSPGGLAACRVIRWPGGSSGNGRRRLGPRPPVRVPAGGARGGSS